MTRGLSPTPRTTVLRGRDRARTQADELDELLADALIAHLGVVVDQHPMVIPVAFGVDRDGPDRGGSLYVHGSPGAQWFRSAIGNDVCLTVTELDGLVVARSAFHHSMNYRSGVIVGAARAVTEPQEKTHALDLIVDHMIPEQSATLREHTGKELTRTAVMAVPLFEASMKVRAHGPVDEESDLDSPAWAGVIDIRRTASEPRTADDCHQPIPTHVHHRAAGLRKG